MIQLGTDPNCIIFYRLSNQLNETMKNLSFKLFALAAVVCCMSASAAKPKFPLLDKAPYDTIIDGQKVALYTIKKGKVAAQIINYGGFVVGLYSQIGRAHV